ncbi:hypothetical protein A8924_7388 [Saccharopolyspora erythraea NRRL 2338]|uniref:Uncharacterized protein n=2 Tax=Saccharopolyspora erythraea TaxID=1836 RepID=A4FQ62_SACEN|nr:hypothetical protein [Saccharopolyspora erythraea]EQD84383.1 hypothetical protein N599_20235 [Saccharopolyspora erythraea D]PFG99833.1 hypothetical protein A8924_7388 [Saccharopolyspora erythraea NRRL 2338]QRK89703.1 hypothetical protein JQX30_35175 [Saccharopolyspora erythraea]CAM06187.1 hypothetical protein SACE_7026 [Saccharopolyspora erythraea NRRL 2338]
MSRHRLEPRNPNNVREVVVGWDSPMRTFYAVVEDHSGAIPVDLGDSIEPVLRPGAVLDAVRPYAAIPPGLDDELLRDALADPGIRAA